MNPSSVASVLNAVYNTIHVYTHYAQRSMLPCVSLSPNPLVICFKRTMMPLLDSSTSRGITEGSNLPTPELVMNTTLTARRRRARIGRPAHPSGQGKGDPDLDQYGLRTRG